MDDGRGGHDDPALVGVRTEEDAALELGAEHVTRPSSRREAIEAVASLTGERSPPAAFRRTMAPRGVDVVYDTIGSADTLEVGVRVACPKAAIVVTGVSRFEWTVIKAVFDYTSIGSRTPLSAPGFGQREGSGATISKP